MLPAWFQTPGAIVLISGGLLACFAGYRVFRIVLGIYGFIFGALLASSAVGPENMLWVVLAAIVGGLIGALILIAAYFLGVALIGAGVGALAANLIWSQLGREPHLIAVVMLAVVGALLALVMQRYVIIVATSFGGAWTAIVGALALMGERAAAQTAARPDVWLAYPLNPAPGEQWVLVAWIGLGLIGMVVQLTLTAGRRRPR